MSKSKLKPIENNFLITSFFGAKPKEPSDNEPTTSSIAEIPKEPSGNEPTTSSITEKPKTAGFYESCVIEKIENCTPCSIELIAFKENLVVANNKLNEIKKAIDFCVDIGRYKDEKIKQLQAGQLVAGNLSNSNQAMSSQSSLSQPSLSQSMPFQPKSFSKFEDTFTEYQLSKLRSVKVDKPGDSNFVLQGVRFLYSSNLAGLSKKSVRGKSNNKTAVTPEKLKLMKEIFDERLELIGIDKTEQEKRATRFNNLFHTAISNINKKNKNSIDSELVDRINEAYSEN